MEKRLLLEPLVFISALENTQVAACLLIVAHNKQPNKQPTIVADKACSIGKLRDLNLAS